MVIKNKKNSSNSLVFGWLPQTKIIIGNQNQTCISESWGNYANHKIVTRASSPVLKLFCQNAQHRNVLVQFDQEVWLILRIKQVRKQSRSQWQKSISITDYTSVERELLMK